MPVRAVLLLLLGAGTVAVAADAPPGPPAEDQRIEALLGQVAAARDLRFVRNGSEYDAATAVKFLRAKWNHQRDEIRTVQDFIDKAATKSSTTGQPYQIKFKDGHSIPCRDYLARLLTAP